MRFSVGKRIILGFLVLIIMMCIIGGFSLVELQTTGNLIDQIQTIYFPRYSEAERVATNIWVQMANVRGYLLTQEESYLVSFEQALTDNRKSIQDLIDGSQTEEGRQLAEEVKQLEEDYAQVIKDKVILLAKQGDLNQAIMVNKNEALPLVEHLTNHVNEYNDRLKTQMNEQIVTSQEATKQATLLVIIIGLVSLILAGLFSVFIPRSIINPLNQLVEASRKAGEGNLTQRVEVTRQDELGDLATAFNQMIDNLGQLVKQAAVASEQLSANSEEMTASTEQTASAMQQISSVAAETSAGSQEASRNVEKTAQGASRLLESAQEVADKAQAASVVSQGVNRIADEGQKLAVNAERQMELVRESTENTAAKIKELGDRSQQIGRIVEVITNIAGQTNLLALNAAIEAARAGEQGRGFAVVAEEVRQLAEQSQEAAKQITDIIRQIQQETNSAVAAMQAGTLEVQNGVQVVNETGLAMQRIISEIEKSSVMIENILTAAQLQAKESKEIAQAIQQLSAIAEQTAAGAQTSVAAIEETTASMEEITASIQALAKIAEDQHRLIGKFVV